MSIGQHPHRRHSFSDNDLQAIRPRGTSVALLEDNETKAHLQTGKPEMKLIFAIVGALTFGAWAPAPAPTTPNATDDLQPRVVVIHMVDKGSAQWRFEPAKVQVRRGDVLRFVQDDIAPHNVQFKDTPDGAQLEPTTIMGPFLIQKGSTYEIQMDDRFPPGVYKFACTPHEPLGMVGEFEVIESDSTP